MTMAKKEISNLELKIKLTTEHLNNGGIEKIWDADLLKDLAKVKKDVLTDETDPDTISTRVNAFMMALLASHMTPPFYHPEHISEYQSTLQKANSFSQENIDTTEQFDTIYEKYKDAKDILFRGQREAKWRLYSKLQRDWIAQKLFNEEQSYQQLIEKMISIGKAEFGPKISQLLDTYHIDTENTVSVLGYLQHHGCPTPFLDWTYIFQNALYFGLDQLTPNQGTIEIENYFSVYFIKEVHFAGGDWRGMIQEALDNIEQPKLMELIAKIAKDDATRKKMEEHFSGRKLFDKSRFAGSGLISRMVDLELLMKSSIGYFSDKDLDSGIIFSLNNSKNILNQAGVFTWNPDPYKPLEMIGEEEHISDGKENKNYKFCRCFNINKKLLNHIKQKLKADGITEEFVYPTPEISTWDVFEKCIVKKA
jgi:hypothetical protein